MNTQIKLDPHVYEELVKLASKLNIPPEQLANKILYEVLEENNIILPEAKKLYKLIKTKYKASKHDAWLHALSLHIDAGHKIIQMIREVTKDAMDIGYRLEDISLQIWEGIDRVWIKLYKTRWGTPWSHEASIDLCENGTAQVFIESIIGFKDKLGSQAEEIEEKLEEK